MLKKIIDRTYQEFSKYRATLPLDACINCCMTIEETTKLASMSVESIPQKLLANYNDSAKPKKTRIEEVKHFLPRYLELISEFNFPTHSSELSFSRLVPFDKNEWTKNEYEILINFQLEYFKHCLNTYPIPSFGDKIDSIIIMFWESGIGIEKLLLVWEETESLESNLHFKDLYFEGFEQYNRSKLSNSFGDKELCEKLTTWIQNPKVNCIFQERIERIILGNSTLDEQTIYEFNLLYDIIRTEIKNGT
jgi:hypothetical protein